MQLYKVEPFNKCAFKFLFSPPDGALTSNLKLNRKLAFSCYPIYIFCFVMCLQSLTTIIIFTIICILLVSLEDRVLIWIYLPCLSGFSGLCLLMVPVFWPLLWIVCIEIFDSHFNKMKDMISKGYCKLDLLQTKIGIVVDSAMVSLVADIPRIWNDWCLG